MGWNVFCTKSAMNDVVYGHMTMMSTGAMITAEPLGCGAWLHTYSKYVVYK